MHAWESVQKTLNYIETHLGEEIAVEELADIAALSLFYYQRLFTRLVKTTVREYIKLRRLAVACAALREKHNRIVDVALACGFGSHETFTRAFKEVYGITPAQYRGSSAELRHFDKPDLLLNYVLVDEGSPLISDGLVLEMSRRTLEAPIHFLGVEGHIPFQRGKMLGERPGVDLVNEIWREFFRVLPDIPAIPGGRRIGVTYHGDAPEGHTTCFSGEEVPRGVEGGRFASWQLPAREYVVCGFEAENGAELTGSALGKAMRYTRLWLREHGLTADGFFPELYHQEHNPPDVAYMELWIPFRLREKDKKNEEEHT